MAKHEKGRLRRYYAYSLNGAYFIKMLFRDKRRLEAEFRRTAADGDNIVVDQNGSVHHNVNISKYWTEEEYLENQEHLE